MTTILCTSVRKNNRESLTGDRRGGRRPLPSLRTPPSLPVPEHRDTALAHASARENPSESPEHRRLRVSFFHPAVFLLRKGFPQPSPASRDPSRWVGSGRGAAMSAGGAAGLPAPRWRPPARYRAAPAGGEGGSSPAERGWKSVRRSLLLLLLLFLKIATILLFFTRPQSL